MLSLDATTRVSTEVGNRIKLAWCKFNQHRRWLTNRHIPLTLRMRFFEMTVRPTALFGLHVLPLGAKCCERIGATERKMKRCIVGWVRQADEDWAATMRRMRDRVARAGALYKAPSWEEVVEKQRSNFFAHLQTSQCHWPRLLMTWTPPNKRPRGRP